MQRCTAISAALAVVFIYLSVAAECSKKDSTAPPAPAPTCSKKCIAENCKSFGIRYGKYCGVGYTGCKGEKPCDDLDACCKQHDKCVDKKGMDNVKCHEKLKKCLVKVQKSGKVGFSKQCPYSVAAPTMIQSIDAVIRLIHG